MALDIYHQGDNQRARRLATVEADELQLFSDVLADFKTKTSIEIDCYGTTRIAVNQLETLKNLVAKALESDGRQVHRHTIGKQLIAVLEKLCAMGKPIIIHGD